MILERLIAMAKAVHDKEGLEFLTRELVRAGFHRPRFEGQVCVELMGHCIEHGEIEEVDYLDAKFLRIKRADGTWRLCSPQSIYAISPALETEPRDETETRGGNHQKDCHGECGGTFECQRCHRGVGYCFGAEHMPLADGSSHPADEWCDECWAEVYGGVP